MQQNSEGGFTLVELLIGVSLALMIMTAVLTSYVTLARNFTRSLGVSSATQPTLETQSRRTLAYFAQDVRMTSSLADTTNLSATRMSLIIPMGSTTNTITYYYNTTAIAGGIFSDDVTINGVSVQMRREALTRCVYNGATISSLVLVNNIVSGKLAFRYYDTSGNPYDNGLSPYTTITAYSGSVKQVSMSFTTQAGSSVNGTLSQLYEANSPRLIIRNKALLP